MSATLENEPDAQEMYETFVGFVPSYLNSNCVLAPE